MDQGNSKTRGHGFDNQGSRGVESENLKSSPSKMPFRPLKISPNVQTAMLLRSSATSLAKDVQYLHLSRQLSGRLPVNQSPSHLTPL